MISSNHKQVCLLLLVIIIAVFYSLLSSNGMLTQYYIGSTYPYLYSTWPFILACNIIVQKWVNFIKQG